MFLFSIHYWAANTDIVCDNTLTSLGRPASEKGSFCGDLDIDITPSQYKLIIHRLF